MLLIYYRCIPIPIKKRIRQVWFDWTLDMHPKRRQLWLSSVTGRYSWNGFEYWPHGVPYCGCLVRMVFPFQLVLGASWFKIDTNHHRICISLEIQCIEDYEVRLCNVWFARCFTCHFFHDVSSERVSTPARHSQIWYVRLACHYLCAYISVGMHIHVYAWCGCVFASF